VYARVSIFLFNLKNKSIVYRICFIIFISVSGVTCRGIPALVFFALFSQLFGVGYPCLRPLFVLIYHTYTHTSCPHITQSYPVISFLVFLFLYFLQRSFSYFITTLTASVSSLLITYPNHLSLSSFLVDYQLYTTSYLVVTYLSYYIFFYHSTQLSILISATLILSWQFYPCSLVFRL